MQRSELSSRIAALSPEQRARLAQALDARHDRPRTFPLSFAQQRLWFLDQLAPGDLGYVLPGRVRITGRLDVPLWKRCLAEVVRRHDVLRTAFPAGAGEPRQEVSPTVDVPLPVDDLRHLAPGERAPAADRLAAEEFARPFTLDRAPLFRIRLVRLDDEEHLLLITFHHLLADQWTIAVFMREMLALHDAFAAGKPSPLPALPIQYGDFAVWQRRWLDGPVLDEQLAYWTKQLGGAPPALDLPTDRPRPAIQTSNGATHPVDLPRPLYEALRALSHHEGGTLFMTLLAAFQLLLARWSGQDDVVVGSSIANRDRPEIAGLMGFFVNTLVLRTDVGGDPTFRELLARVRTTCLGAYAHQDLPFEKLVEALQPRRDLSRTPLFQASFVFQNVPLPAMRARGLVLVAEMVNVGTARFDLEPQLFESADGVRGWIEYNTDLFDAGTIARLAAHYGTLLEAIVAAPDTRVGALGLLPAAERATVVETWNATARDYGPLVPIPEQIAAQAARTPAAVAVAGEDGTLTYGELETRATALAHHLRTRGVTRDGRVGVCLERSTDLLVALYGVLKAGGAYVPLDPEYPAERLAFMAADAAVPVLLTQARLAAQLPPGAATVVCLDTDWATIAAAGTAPLASGAAGADLAYVIYTSGSTGRPKGAMNTHAGLANRLAWMQEAFALTAADRVLQKTPISFDVSVWELFWPLCVGARLVLARPGGHRDADYLAGLIAQAGITTLHFVPSMLAQFLEAPGLEARGTTLRRVVCSGEALTPALVARTHARLPTADLHNLYGPTEAAIDVTWWPCARGASRATVPIGRPIANTQCYVLDRAGQPVPIGVAGELYLGGLQLARGYLNRPELTAEKFVADPFGPPGGRLYRTGDRVRWAPDGVLEYLGRFDDQLKLRGQRIELGEIAAVLEAHPAVHAAVVVARDDGPLGVRLAAYVVPAADPPPGPSALRAHCATTLPPSMLPASFTVLPALPLGPTGKVDRRALPEPARVSPDLRPEFVAPRSDAERTIAGVWKDVLGLDAVGVGDNFFELGGHSLLLAQMRGRLGEALGRDVPILELFRHPTIASLVDYLAHPPDDAPTFAEADERARSRRAALMRQLAVRQGGRAQARAEQDEESRHV